MSDPPIYRSQPDPAFADRLERALLERLTAPAGSHARRGVAQADDLAPSDAVPDDAEGDAITLESEGQPTDLDPIGSRRRVPGRWLLVAAVAAVVAVVGALLVAGGDDDEQLPAGVPPWMVPEVAAFCDAIDDMGLGVSIGEGYEGLDAALIAAEEIAPAEIKADVTTMADENRAQVAAGAPPDGTPGPSPTLPPDEFFRAADAVGEYMAESCGYPVIEAEASEYSFEGIPATAARGKTLFRLSNDGAEYHQLVLQRVRYGEDRSLEEILALPEGGDLLDFQGTAFAPPGLGSWFVVELGIGRHAVMCIIPTGSTTPEALRSAQAEGTAPPHHDQGMIEEIQVP